jgi:hypothetical protein
LHWHERHFIGLVGIIYHGVGFLRSPAFLKRNAPTLALAQAEFPTAGNCFIENLAPSHFAPSSNRIAFADENITAGI